MFTTKYFKLGIAGVFVFLVAMVFASTVFAGGGAPFSEANLLGDYAKLGYQTIGGDCSANNSIADLFPEDTTTATVRFADQHYWTYFREGSYCEANPGNGQAENSVATLATKIHRVIHEVFTPTATSTDEPQNPTETSTSIPPTDKPTQTPKVTATPKSTDVPEETKPAKTPKPDCHNKNDDKKPNENPTDCNAGGGNG